MRTVWGSEAWDDYVWWQRQDRKTLRRINDLIKDVKRNGNAGIGKPEQLKNDLSGWWSRRINDTDRLVYRIVDDSVEILQCRYHYNK